MRFTIEDKRLEKVAENGPMSRVALDIMPLLFIEKPKCL